MTVHDKYTLPSNGRLLKATGVALVVASVLLVTAVLPAEYGIDPTGVGKRLGLLALAGDVQAAEVAKADGGPQPASGVPSADAETAALAAQAAAVFGAQPGQSFDARAVVRHASAARTETLSLTLEPGKGAELKALVDAGDGFVFHWTASGNVAVDMHGERPAVKDEYTSYWIEGAQREGAGRFVAPFAGQHGWYWLNRGQEPVTVQLSVTGFQDKLFRPGQP
ncbi:MAG TPA: hypothetical protein VFY73_04060 [Ideonella sp.]|uniref:hypothetical protein n=1 Tax=Ideonella sp. TaxID=1929293 RepID=UPI002E2F6613|nr:hypothetical protein [Ideonella sp.]HEX5683190.1 hypothetical protein [Ideonella sp.]